MAKPEALALSSVRRETPRPRDLYTIVSLPAVSLFDRFCGLPIRQPPQGAAASVIRRAAAISTRRQLFRRDLRLLSAAWERRPVIGAVLHDHQDVVAILEQRDVLDGIAVDHDEIGKVAFLHLA